MNYQHDTRKSRDDAWPLRGADGRTFAERKKEEERDARRRNPS